MSAGSRGWRREGGGERARAEAVQLWGREGTREGGGKGGVRGQWREDGGERSGGGEGV